MADLNRLAVLINLSDGDIYGLAGQLQIDSNIIESAINGNPLTRNDDLELQEKMSRFERIELDAYQQAELADYVSEADRVIDIIDDFRNGDNMRLAISQDKVTLSELGDTHLLFGQGDATLNVQNKIIDWLVTNEHSANTFLSLFANDGYRIDRYGKESSFWAWYRETFYND